jgi:predicted secreted hydrolase
MAAPSRRSALGLAVLLAVLLAGAVYLLARRDGPREPRASLSVAGALRGTGTAGFLRATAPRSFRFPADHGPHPGFRTEWWYYTGNLETKEGRRFGFQLTFFRSGLAADPPARTSEWAASQAYLSHFALTDVDGGRFHSFERWSRGALGLAGAQGDPFRVWVESWSAVASSMPPAAPAAPAKPGGPAGTPAMRLTAAEDGIGIDLDLRPGKPVVLQGDRGLSQKSAEPGNASYYYSLTRMPAAGTIRLGDESFPVTGLAWMDREWSTSSLGADQVGWDWFALQLADGGEVMLYRLRRRDGSADPSSSGTLIGPRGEARPLRLADFRLEDLERWKSPGSGARYPSRWRIRIPADGLDLEVRPLLADQELDVSFLYWEGAVEVTGTHQGRPVTGRGYVEMTGYADAESVAGRVRN